MKFQKNIPLKNRTSFKIGGPAKYFFEAKNLKNLFEAVKKAKQEKIPIFIFGGGTKLLVSDKGFDGLVIKILNSKFQILNSKIIADVGVKLGDLVRASVGNNLTGLEWAIGIPGTIGGAVCGNCGAFGSSISEAVKNVAALNPDTLKIKKYTNKECQFGYRESIFSARGVLQRRIRLGRRSAFGGKRNKDIIVSVELRLKKGDSKKSLIIMKEYSERRRKRIPVYPSSGSIFKNYELRSMNYEDDPLVKKFPELKKEIKGGKIPVAYFIEKCGLKGKQIGGAKISEQQANIIVNFNQAKEKDVSSLIDLAKKQVKKKFGVDLEEEIIRL